MTIPESGLPGSAPPTPSRGREVLPLALVVVLWVVVLAHDTLDGDTSIEFRGRLVTAIETDWQARLVEVDAVDVYRLAGERIDAFRSLAARGWGDRSWRLLYRAAKPLKPLAPPTEFKAVLDPSRAVIVLTWKPPAGADVVTIRGRRDFQGSAWDHSVPGVSHRWEDELFELSGTYTYEILSEREDEVSEASAPVTVTFTLDPDMKLVATDLTRRTATIVVGLSDIGHKTGRFLPRKFVVRVGEVVGTQVEGGVDYDTGYRLARLDDLPDWVRVTEDARAFTPEGTIARGPDGRPISRKATFRRPVRKVVATLEPQTADRKVRTLEAPR